MSAPAFRYFKKTLRRKFSRVPSSKALFFTKRIPQSDVRETWHHLCRAAASAEHPFSPEYIGRNWKEDEYLARLVQLGSERGHTATLRTSPQMTAVVSRLLEDVTASAKGKSENLAYSALHYPRPSPKTLVDSLNRLHPFKDAEFRPMIAQVLKLGIRMGVWPDMVPGPFIYAFNARIALLFVNARCVVVSENVKRIDLDDAFQNLSTKVEDLVISYAFQHLTSSNESSYSVWAQAVYGVRPNEVAEWRFRDWVDTWLYSHTRNQCKIKTVETSPTSCNLKLDGDCYCVGPLGGWRLDQDALIRD